jgi:uncharacterized protein
MMILDKYSKIVTKHPFAVIIFCLIISAFFIYGAMQTKTSSMNYGDMLPEKLEEIKASELIKDEFPTSGAQLLFVIEINPNEINSDEPNDIRDVRVAEYIDLLSQKISTLRGVAGTISYTDLLKSLNNERIPKSNNSIKEIISNSPASTGFENYISNDYSVAIMRVYLAEMTSEEEDELIEDLDNILNETQKPAGIKCDYTGDIKVSKEIQNSIGPTMSSTSSISLIAILIIVCLLFWSIRQGLISLLAIAFGTTWVFGTLGFIGLEISSMMSGAISMIMGVGIDFGIQVVNRFKQEIEKNEIEEAMKITLNNTLPQMTATTIAALIGFRAMSLGQLTILKDLSTMMSLGILFCFLAAAIIVPPILVLNERFTPNAKKQKIKNKRKN